MNPFLVFARWLLRLRWLWDIAYGLLLIVGLGLVVSTSRWVGVGTIVVGAITLAADIGLGKVRT